MKSLIQKSKYLIIIPVLISAILILISIFFYSSDFLGEGLISDGCIGPYRSNSFSSILIKLSLITGEFSTLLVSSIIAFKILNKHLQIDTHKLVFIVKTVGIILLVLTLTSIGAMIVRYESLDDYLRFLLWGTTAYGENELASSPFRFLIQSLLFLVTYINLNNPKKLGVFSKTKRAIALAIFIQIFTCLGLLIFVVKANYLVHDEFFYEKSFNTRFIRVVASTFHYFGFSNLIVLFTILLVKLKRLPNELSYRIE